MVDTSRGAFVLIAADAPTCDRWCDALSDTLRSLAAETVAAADGVLGGDRQLAVIERRRSIRRKRLGRIGGGI